MKFSLKIFLSIFIISAIFFGIYYKFKEKNQKYFEYNTISINESTYDVVKVLPEKINSITFNFKNKNQEKYETIKNLKTQNPNIIFATNGGIFSKNFDPLGLYIEKGQEVSGLNTDSGEGNFFLQPNGVFLIKQNSATIVETKNYETDYSVTNAIQSGPVLVLENKINQNFTIDSQNKYIRSGVGVDDEGSVFFAISNQPVNFFDFASLFKKDLHCPNALYLDGSISEMYIPKARENTNEQFSVIIGIEKK